MARHFLLFSISSLTLATDDDLCNYKSKYLAKRPWRNNISSILPAKIYFTVLVICSAVASLCCKVLVVRNVSHCFTGLAYCVNSLAPSFPIHIYKRCYIRYFWLGDVWTVWRERKELGRNRRNKENWDKERDGEIEGSPRSEFPLTFTLKTFDN